MRMFLPICVSAALLLLAVAPLMAEIDPEWAVEFNAMVNDTGWRAVTLGTGAYCHDEPVLSYEDWSLGLPGPEYPTCGVIVSAWPELPDGLSMDRRDALTDANDSGNPKVWNLRMWIHGASSGQVNLEGYLPGATWSQCFIDGDQVVVQLRRNGETPWTVPRGEFTWETAPTYDGPFDYSGTPIDLQVIAWVEPVPEPSSLAALALGLAGIVVSKARNGRPG